jgi:hypothetical protein
VLIHPEAVASHSGVVPFYLHEPGGNEGISSMVPAPGLRQAAEQVASICLDEFASSLGNRQPDVVKIDVEGAEADVFAGARQLLASPSAPSVILFESLDGSESIRAMLEESGYAVRGVHYSLENGLVFPDPKDTETIRALRTHYAGQGTLDYVAVRQDVAAEVLDQLVSESRERLPDVLRLLAKCF